PWPRSVTMFSRWPQPAALNQRRRLRSFLGRDPTSPSDVQLMKPVLLKWAIRRFRIVEKLGETSATSWLIQVRRGMYVLRGVRSTEAYVNYQVLVVGGTGRAPVKIWVCG